MRNFSLLQRAEAIWHRLQCVPLAVESPIPPIKSQLFPKGSAGWGLTLTYNSPIIDFPPIARLLNFQPGHVLTLGGDHYRIHRKVRGQSTSTVWLAEHTVRGATRRRFVALEAFDTLTSYEIARQARAEPRSPTIDLNYIRNIISAQDRGLPGADHLDRLRAVFLADRQLYAIKDPTGPTVWHLQLTQPNESFSLEVTKRIIKDTLRALQYIHSFGRAAVGVASHNLLVAQPDSKDTVSSKIIQFLQSHPPETIDPSTDSKKSSTTTTTTTTTTTSPTPKRKNLAAVLKSQPLPAFDLSPSLDNIRVRLTRCEHATLEKRLLDKHAAAGDKPPRLSDYFHSELRIAAPEALRGAPERWAPPVNIWAVGNLVFQFLTGHYIYTAFRAADADGPPLPSWPELVFMCHPRTRMLEQRLLSFPHVAEALSDADVRATCAFVSRCLEMDPARRPTAAELLQDEWFST